jgi:nucleotide-binding universal stress UspA family protein
MFRHILAPVDFSPLSALGLRYAGALARCADASITVLFANPFLPPPYFTPARTAELERQFREGVREAETQLRAFTEAALGAESARASLTIVEALPVDAIIAAAEPGRTDLIVMGSRGLSSSSRFKMGSVASQVAKYSPCSVYLVKMHAA